MACEYCNGSERNLEIQPFTETDVSAAFVEPDGKPAICICADSAWTYITEKFCPMCGRDLRGDDQ